MTPEQLHDICRTHSIPVANNGEASAEDVAITALALLSRIAALLEALPAAIAAAQDHAKGRSLSAADRKTLGILMPAILRAIGDSTFSVHDLLEHAGDDSALAEALRTTGLSTRQLGKLFARAHGFELDGCRLDRLGEARDGLLWCVAAVKKPA